MILGLGVRFQAADCRVAFASRCEWEGSLAGEAQKGDWQWGLVPLLTDLAGELNTAGAGCEGGC